MKQSIKVMTVDDNAIYRKIISTIIKEIDKVDHVETAPNGKVALNIIEKDRPDLVILDIEMPELDGVETLKIIKTKYPDIGVIMASSVTSIDNTDATIKALELGAIDFVSKPQRSNDMEESLNYFRRKLTPLVQSFIVRKLASAIKEKNQNIRAEGFKLFSSLDSQQKSSKISGKNIPKDISLIIFGVSTGGPNTLNKIIPSLPKNFPVPILIVQHMPALFTQSLAKSLNSSSQLTVVEAENGQEIVPGHVYIAPGAHHMTVNRSIAKFTIQIDKDEPINNFRPCVDKLISSASPHFQGKTVHVILTGMGNDGTASLKEVKDQGNWCIAQDEDSCTVFGMSRSIIDNDLADEVLADTEIAKRLIELTNR